MTPLDQWQKHYNAMVSRGMYKHAEFCLQKIVALKSQQKSKTSEIKLDTSYPKYRIYDWPDLDACIIVLE